MLNYNVFEDNEYVWTYRLIRFNKLIWHQQYYFPDMQRELSSIAFGTYGSIFNSVVEVTNFEKKFVESQAEAEEIEERLCVDAWDFASYLVPGRKPPIFKNSHYRRHL